MTSLLAKLIDLLDEEENHLQSLVSILKKEAAAVILSDFQLLNEILKEKENEILKIRFLDVQRQKIIGKLSKYVDCPIQKLTLSLLVQHVEASYSQQLKNFCVKLERLMKTVHEWNQKNRGLVEQSLGLVRDSLSLLDNILAPSPVYYSTGRLTNTDHSGRVLCGSV